ncbi:MAG TPA: branched-chain amino acid ABC transporter permease [Acidimicrobiia bacterium]|jgi:branched-chain amino acid transport system permease protein|nr:branched-chain amino acid ABC transporter permease [Acidimicrobiia bacterium]
MTATANDASTFEAPGLDWRRQIRFSAIGALSCAFIALAGMPVGLDRRSIVYPVLSLGYLSLFWVPFVLASLAGSQVVLEGMGERERDTRDLAAGALVGLGSALGLVGLMILVKNFNLRDPLVNWSPQLLELLSFNRSTTLGMLLWVVLGTTLGLLGGAMHVVPAMVRAKILTVVLSVLIVSVLQTFLTDLLEGFRLEVFTDFIYYKRGGLEILGALLVAVLAIAIPLLVAGRIKGLRARVQKMPPDERSRVNLVLLGVGAALLLVLPFFLGKIANELLANVGLFVLLALGLNIVVGLAGILDLGYVAFFAVGGYTTAVLTSPNSPGFSPELPWPVALIVVVVLTGLVGLFIGAPVIRMRGDYLAIVTLGFGEIIRLLFLSDWLSGWFGGAQGITNIPGVDVGIGTVKGTDPRSVFLLVLVFCGIAIYVSWRLEHSRLGRAWMAIREDEDVAEAMGVNTTSTKLMAFVVGAVLASFSGAIFSAKVGSIFPTSFIMLVSIIILVVVIVGGMGNIAGVIVGAVVLIGVLGGPKQPGLLQELGQFKLLIYGALLVWMMLKRPEGLVPNVRRSRELHQEEFLQDAWLKGEIDEEDPS